MLDHCLGQQESVLLGRRAFQNLVFTLLLPFLHLLYSNTAVSTSALLTRLTTCSIEQIRHRASARELQPMTYSSSIATRQKLKALHASGN